MPGACDTILDRLLAADPGRHRPDEGAWREFVEHVAETLDIGPGTSVFDVGCGSGAFLFPLWENGYVVGGIDPSEALVELALGAMPGQRIAPGSPWDLDPAEAWDVVVASGGLRATGPDRGRAMLARMVAKARHAVALLDLPDEPPETSPSRAALLRMLAEIGAGAVQFEAAPGGRFHVFARL